MGLRGGQRRVPSAGRRGRGGRWGALLGAHRVLALVAILLTLGLVGTSLVVYAGYLKTFGSINRIAIPRLGHGQAPPVYNSAENILLIGAYNSSKDYVLKHNGASSDIGADTYVLVHIMPNHKGAVLISFPRDAEVPVLNCPRVNTRTSSFQGQTAQPGGSPEPLNETYALGGPGCALITLEQQTGIHISHFIVIDYLAFENFVKALGGANVCSPVAVSHVQYAPGLRLKKGMNHLNGKRALQFVRARFIGQNSDLQRIKRQQLFMISLMQSAIKQGLLTNFGEMYHIADSVVPDLTVDTGFGLTAIYNLAKSMAGVSLSRVQLIEVPVVPYPPDPLVKVIWVKSQVEPLFSAIAHNKKVSKKLLRKAKAKATPTPSAPSVKPSQVQVDVLNGNGVLGGAATAQTDLTNAGFQVTGTGNAASFSYSASVVQYSGKSELAAAKLLADDIPGATVQQTTGITSGTVTLIIGQNFNGVTPPSTAKHHSSAKSVTKVVKKYANATGSTNVCSSQATQAAFAP